ncbi:MAG: serine/threonine protein kinase [Alphaproteobacteria bacterium]|nr:serine/threonine protein kinase [Alphaproteobacteria bacterium]
MNDTSVRVGRFVLQSEVGAGGMGVVWSAVEVASPQRRVAIKLMTRDGAADEAYRHAFLNEIGITAALRHPHVVDVWDWGELPDGPLPPPLVPDSPWMAMTFAEGGTLRQHGGRMAWARIQEVLLEVLAGLEHVHGHRLLHLDVKPSNVLLDAEGRAMLSDFGLARSMDPTVADPEEDAPRWGTPAYMAPEQLQDDIQAWGPWTDLYALGCVAWSLVAGRPPFGRAPEEAILRHLYDPLPRLRALQPVPPQLEGWLQGMLAKKGDQRFRDAGSAARSLRELGAPVSTGAPPASPWTGSTAADSTTTLLVLKKQAANG